RGGRRAPGRRRSRADRCPAALRAEGDGARRDRGRTGRGSRSRRRPVAARARPPRCHRGGGRMSCSPGCSCGCGAPAVALAPPPPGETHLRRRVGEFHGFVADLAAFVEQQQVDGTTLGTRWDIEADPAALRLVELWAYVAETIAAYSELTAGEAYLPTA